MHDLLVDITVILVDNGYYALKLKQPTEMFCKI